MQFSAWNASASKYGQITRRATRRNSAMMAHHTIDEAAFCTVLHIRPQCTHYTAPLCTCTVRRRSRLPPLQQHERTDPAAPPPARRAPPSDALCPALRPYISRPRRRQFSVLLSFPHHLLLSACQSEPWKPGPLPATPLAHCLQGL